MQNTNPERQEFKEKFRARIKKLVLDLINFIESLPNNRTCKIIGDQLMRSGTSVGANYFESKGASSKNDFINFFNYALKSANESKFWLEILIDLKQGNTQKANILLKEVNEIANMFASSIIKLRAKK